MLKYKLCSKGLGSAYGWCYILKGLPLHMQCYSIYCNNDSALYTVLVDNITELVSLLCLS